MRTSSVWMLALIALVLVACGRPNDTRAPAATPGATVTPEAIQAATGTSEPPSLSLKTDVNASEAEAAMKNAVSTPNQPSANGSNQSLYVAAQDAATRAADTASGDEAKKRVIEGGMSAEGVGDSSKPQAADLSKAEESIAMPKPGQANDHSSPDRAGESGAQRK